MWGSSNPGFSFDCSGLTTYAYKEAGILLPRTSYNQALVGKTISLNEAKAGDLLFFGKNGVSHVGIYTGNYTMVHASPSKGVCYVNLNEYNMGNFRLAKNIIDF
ncbi:C40 family peptidase [Peptoniphilus timonensis]|uniref:C40 family peptidase n=1 Tax=Peptoniphilus timonensis TaxID=1268254 RepID=UPI001FE19417|nr:C40 family peptidase [Peptoniphilus timonensis]